MAKAKPAGQGAMKGAPPTSPGGMSQPALKVELVEKHGFKMADLRDVKWPVLIDMVVQGRLDREKEFAASKEGQGLRIARVVPEDEADLEIEAEQVVSYPGQFTPDDDDLWADDDLDDIDSDDDEYLLVKPEPEPVCVYGCGKSEAEHKNLALDHQFFDAELYDLPAEDGPDAEDFVPDQEWAEDMARDAEEKAAVSAAFAAIGRTEPDDTDDTDDVEALLNEASEAHEAALAEQAKQSLLITNPDNYDFIFDGHAGAGPSAAERWMTCTASLAATREFLETFTPNQQKKFAGAGLAARQGTIAHMLGEIRLRQMLGEVDDFEVETTILELSTMPDSEQEAYSDEMEEHVSEYVTLVQQYVDSGREVLVESRVSAVVPLLDVTQTDVADETGEYYEVKGSADAIALPNAEENVLTVVDLKYGEGIDVDVDENPQVRIYGLGALSELADDEGNLPDIDHMEYVIVQPRLGGIKTWTESVEDLLTWRDEVLAPALSLALAGPEGGATYNPTEVGCQWCPVRGACPALAEQRIEEAAGLFEALNEAAFEGENIVAGMLDHARLGDLLTQINGLVSLQKDLKAEAQRRLHRGEEVPGFWLVNYQPKREWSGDVANEFDPADKRLWEPAKPKSPAQALAAVADDEDTTAYLESQIVKPDKVPLISTGAKDRRSKWEGKPPEMMFEDES